MNKPLLSICLPTYNRAEKLAKALRRLANELSNQTPEHYEVFIGDNASTDATGREIDAFVKEYPAIIVRVVCHPNNLGPDFNFHYLLTNARGQYAFLLSDDDQLIKGRLVEIISILSNLPDATPLCIDTHGFSKRKKWQLRKIFPDDVVVFGSSETALLFMGSGLFFLSSTIIPTKLLNAVSNYPGMGTHLYQAYIFSEVIANAGDIALINSPLVEHTENTKVSYNLSQVLVANYSDYLRHLPSLGFSKQMVKELSDLHYIRFLHWGIIGRRLLLEKIDKGYAKDELRGFRYQIRQLIKNRKVSGRVSVSLLSAVYVSPVLFRLELMVRRVVKIGVVKVRSLIAIRQAFWGFASLYVFLVTSIVAAPKGWIFLKPAFKIWEIKYDKDFWVCGNTTILSGKNLRVGRRVAMGSRTRIAAYSKVIIGDDFLAAPGLNIDTGGHDVDTLKPISRPVVIGSRVWCGLNVIICGGVEIGNDVVIGAGSVVTKSIPSGVVAAGVPCRVLRKKDGCGDSEIWSAWRDI